MNTLVHAIKSGSAALAWYVKGVMGEDAYDKYVAHQETQHAGSVDEQDRTPVMTEREFWRDLSDRQERNPQGRCC